MKVTLAHPGTQYSFRLAAQLQRRGLLEQFCTGIAIVAEGRLGQSLALLPRRLRRALANRLLESVPARKLCCFPQNEMAALLRLRFGGDAQQVLYRRNEAFQRAIADYTLRSSDAIIGFDTSAWILARRCAAMGIPLLLDQSIGHPDSKIEVFERVRTRFPDWSEGIEPRLPEVRQAEQEEHDRAAVVVAASSFTQTTLVANGVLPQKIVVNPYGVDSARFTPHSASGSRPCRFVFVGAITARKGVPLLLEAWQNIRRGDAELWLVGPASNRIAALIPQLAGLKYLGPVPHGEVPAILTQCDVLVFPSYFEGFGLVILEAMASGLPVITTTATAGPDLFSHGKGGWLIEAGNRDQLVAAMEGCLADPEAVKQASRTARTIAEGCTWEKYGERWSAILQSAVARETNAP